MEIEEINEIADAWIAAQNFEGGASKSPDWWAVDKEMEWGFDDPETLWTFIQIVNSRENTPKVVAILAAGPVENLIAYHGEEYIDRIIEFARKDPKFNYVLGGVWESGTKEVWEKILEIRNHVW
jgi:hypothetical protein